MALAEIQLYNTDSISGKWLIALRYGRTCNAHSASALSRAESDHMSIVVDASLF